MGCPVVPMQNIIKQWFPWVPMQNTLKPLVSQPMPFCISDGKRNKTNGFHMVPMQNAIKRMDFICFICKTIENQWCSFGPYNKNNGFPLGPYAKLNKTNGCSFCAYAKHNKTIGFHVVPM